MAGVGEQRGGVADIAVDRLGDDQRGVERDADREGLAEARGRVAVRVTMVMRMAGMIVLVMTVMVLAAHP